MDKGADLFMLFFRCVHCQHAALAVHDDITARLYIVFFAAFDVFTDDIGNIRCQRFPELVVRPVFNRRSGIVSFLAAATA